MNLTGLTYFSQFIQEEYTYKFDIYALNSRLNSGEKNVYSKIVLNCKEMFRMKSLSNKIASKELNKVEKHCL